MAGIAGICEREPIAAAPWRRLPMRHADVPLAFLLLVLIAIAPAYGQFNPLYNFGSSSGDPTQPIYSGIVAQGSDGNVYSTAPQGGSMGHGAIFKITIAGTVTVLHSFDGSDGSAPEGGLTLANDGSKLYGTTCS